MMMQGGEGRARLQCQVQPVTHALHPAAQIETNCPTVLAPQLYWYQLYWHFNCTGTSTVLAPERSVADQDHACHFDADPDPDFNFDADADRSFKLY
jgi:hypothetical protein